MKGINDKSKSANKELDRAHHKMFSKYELMNVKTVLDTWFPESLIIRDRIIVSSDPVIITYRMSLGSVFYDSGIKIGMLKHPDAKSFHQAIQFLEINYPQVLDLWADAKGKTETHLKRIANLWQRYIVDPVDNIFNILKDQTPSLSIYEGHGNPPESYFVKTNIIKTLHDEIYHYVETGEWLKFFRINESQKHVGNGYTYIKSSDPSLLKSFVNLINGSLHDEKMLDEFKSAEMGKVNVEAKVLKLRKSLLQITVTL